MSALLVPVMDRYAKAWPAHAEQPCPICTPKGKRCTGPDTAEPFTLERAFSEHFDDDPHFTAYATVNDHRLDHGAIGLVPITMQLFVVDVEPAGHAPRTPEWDADQQPRIARAISDGAFFYSTRGGYRLVWTIAPFPIATPHDAARWKASYLAALDDVRERYEIVGDPNCKDWTRLYRLPFVVRDGVPQLPEVSDGTIGAWSLRVVEPTAATTTTVAPINLDDEIDPELIDHVRKQLREHGPAIAHAEHPPDGHGGDEHTFRACALVRDYALPDDVEFSLLMEWDADNDPPWGADGIRTKMDNADAHAQSERGAKRAEWEQLQRLRERWGSPSTPAPIATDASAPTAIALPSTTTGAATSTLDELAGERTEWQQELDKAEAEIKSKLGTSTSTDHVPEPLFIPAVDLLRTKFTEPPWLVRELIKRGGTAIIAGAPKCGKSWALLEAAIAINSGTAAFGSFLTGKPLRVAYFFAEDHAPDVQAHTVALAAGRGMDPEQLVRNLYLQPRGHFIDVLDDRHLALLIASARKLGGVDVLAIEPLRDIHSGEENESDDMSAVMRRLRLLGEILGASILTAHHTNNGGDLRGSSAIRGAYDSLLLLSPGTGGNGRDIIAAHVEVTTKGVRGAGEFDWRLEIEDDAEGHSTRAKWNVIRRIDAARTTSDHERNEKWADVRAVVEHVTKLQANGNEQTLTELRSSVPDVPDKRCRVAIGFALAEGYLRQGEISDRDTGRGRKGERIRIGTVPLPKIPPLSLVASLLADTEPKAKLRAIKTTEIKP